MSNYDPLVADVDWDDNGQPISTKFNDVYFSKTSGLEETRYVFIQHNDLENRFRLLQAHDIFTIAETGFGSGLNFLCAWQCWEMFAPKDAILHFISVEKFPLRQNDFAKALSLWPELSKYSKCLIEQYPAVDAKGFHRLTFGSRIRLTLIFDDAEQGLNQLLPIDKVGPNVETLDYGWCDAAPFSGWVDAWFLDGFAPSKNPEMWSDALFKTMARLSQANSAASLPRKTTLATFTVAGVVRRGLQEHGFAVEKTSGYGKKREMLQGIFVGKISTSVDSSSSHHLNQKSNTTPEENINAQHIHRIKPDPSWHLCRAKLSTTKNIVVIGAGLAGCQTAFALAQKGFKVTIVEQNQTGTGASGNPQGILYSKLSQSQGVFTDFNLTAYLFAARFYQQHGFFDTVGNNCGVLQLADTAEQSESYRLIASNYLNSKELVVWLSSEQASERAGVSLEFGGLWLPQAGWLNPPLLCKSLTNVSNINVLENSSAFHLFHNGARWQIEDCSRKSITTADAVVIACAYSAKNFEQCKRLPTKAIRGQITTIKATAQSTNLRTVLCGEGYISPQSDGVHCIGATFDLRSSSSELNQQDHRINLANIANFSKDFQNIDEPQLSHGRVSFRCTTPDYLPIVGPVANEDTMLERFSGYRSNFKRTIDKPGEYWPGLYVNIGHGSKGLTYTPLCAELLACMINNEPLPLPRDLITHLHSARFLMRDLARNRL